MSIKGTPLSRLEQAVEGKSGKEEVPVLAGDVIDCGGGTAAIRKERPGTSVSLPASDVLKLCKERRSKQSKAEEDVQKEQAQARKDHEDAKELVRIQDEELQKLRKENEALKQKASAK